MATARLDPTGETSIGSGAGAWNTPIWSKMLQSGVTDPTAPDTSTPASASYVDGDDVRIKVAVSNLSDVDVATAFTIHYYARGMITVSGIGYHINGSQVGSTDQTQTLGILDGYGWRTLTFSGLSLSQSDLNTLEILFDPIASDSGSASIDIAAMYVVVTYDQSTPPSGSSGTALLMELV